MGENDSLINLKLDALQKGFDSLQCSMNEHIKSNKTDFEMVNERITTRVKFSTFAWALGVLMTIVIGLFGVIYNRLESVNDKAEITKNDVSYIKGTLQKAEITADQYENKTKKKI